MLCVHRAPLGLALLVVCSCSRPTVDHAPIAPPEGPGARPAPREAADEAWVPDHEALDGDVAGGPSPTHARAVARLEPVSPVFQEALAGAPVTAPGVRALSAGGEPLEDVEVFFRATGLTEVTGAKATTGPDGIARAESWTLSPLIDVNRVIAEVGGQALVFSAETLSDLRIDLVFSGTLTLAQEQSFERARDRWSGVLINDLPDVTVSASALRQGCGIEANDVAVDDVLIFASAIPIDGAGGILGQAGPCIGRNGDGSPAVGVMEFDADDLERLEADGMLEVVILHEMAHVLGLGTLWQREGLLENPSVPNAPGADTHFTGAAARAAFERSGGATLGLDTGVPVENRAVPGSSDGHWRETIFDAELMSPGLRTGDARSPLSEVTAASFEDLGFYSVNYDATDPYAFASGAALVQQTPSLRMDCALVYPGAWVD